MSIKNFLVSDRNPAKNTFVCVDCLRTAPAEIKIKIAEELATENIPCSYCEQENYAKTMDLSDLADFALERLFEDYEKTDEVLATSNSHDILAHVILPELGIENLELVGDLLDAIDDFLVRSK